MLSKLLKRKPPLRAPENPAVPEGTIVWAVGDIHGRLDLLEPLVAAIMADAAASEAHRKVCIFLGDYIDRGTDSRGVIRYLMSLQHEPNLEWRFLRGNHEEAMLDFLEDASSGPQWCEYGGDATLESYGLRLPTMRHKVEAWAHLAADLDHKLTDEELCFLQALEVSVALGDYFFVHAGARPGVPLDEQTTGDMLWIRKTFLESEVEFDRVIVHGHTPERNVHADHRRIGVDTKAYASDMLTAVRLYGHACDAIQTVSIGNDVAIRRVAVGRPTGRRAA